MSNDVRATGSDNSDTPTYNDISNNTSTSVNETNTLEKQEDGDSNEEENEENEEDEEPKLKYARLTGHIAGVYRNGDSTSTFTVAGDKVVLGTHNGIVHVFSLPSMQNIGKPVQVHQASVTSVSMSPAPLPYFAAVDRTDAKAPHSTASRAPASSASPRKHQKQASTTNSISRNQIYIGTASMDGHVCILSLSNPNDVQRRNFARPINAVALSPEYKSDRTYLSGGRAGQLILTEGGKSGVTIDANTNSAAAAASGWLGSIGLSSDRGKDTALHSGEGAISSIRWSLSGKWVVWVNEEGIKIMRSHLKLGPENSEDAWKRISHAQRPNRMAWETMAGVWKGRCEWINEQYLEEDDPQSHAASKPEIESLKTTAHSTPSKKKRSIVEKLLVGWGDTVWLLHITEGGTIAHGQRPVGSVAIIHKLVFTDCIISGISMYSPSLVAILAWRTTDDDDRPIEQIPDTDSPRKGRSHRQTGLHPQLRLVDIASGDEDAVDDIPISRSQTLSSQDYHLGTIYVPRPVPSGAPAALDHRGALEGFLDVAGGRYAARIFSSGASVMSGSSGGLVDGSDSGRNPGITSPQSSVIAVAPSALTSPGKPTVRETHPWTITAGLKFFIQSPYDCILAVRRDLADQLAWSLELKRYEEAWRLMDRHPEIVDISSTERRSIESRPQTPSRGTREDASLADFFTDDTSTRASANMLDANVAQQEKQRVGELWLDQLVSDNRWREAGQVAEQVLQSSSNWNMWVTRFINANKLDSIITHIPSPDFVLLASEVYTKILEHYVDANPSLLMKLLDGQEKWEMELFDVVAVIHTAESRIDELEAEPVEGKGGKADADWKLLTEALAKLYLGDGRPRDALGCYVRVQDAEAALNLIREESLISAVEDDVPGILTLRIDRRMMQNAKLEELEDACSEALQILVDEALSGSIPMKTVISQLNRAGNAFQPFLFLYLRAIWNNARNDSNGRRRMFDRTIEEGHALLEQYADLAVEMFAEYDRDLLKTFLVSSSAYNLDKAIAICKQRGYVKERVHVLEKTGQLEEALFLIIDELGDVKDAIRFAKDHPDVWEKLVEYSMDDRPPFICGLLEEGGTTGNPIDLIKRIPEGLHIEGLREGVAKLMREYEIHHSITEGAARVLRSEVLAGMDILRAGRRRGIRFDITHGPDTTVLNEEKLKDSSTVEPDKLTDTRKSRTMISAGYCATCNKLFTEDESEPLLGFPCGHVLHLSCVLRSRGEDEATVSRLFRQLGYGAYSSSLNSSHENLSFAGRSVGAKVAHAHAIQNAVRGGCPLCNTVSLF